MPLPPVEVSQLSVEPEVEVASKKVWIYIGVLTILVGLLVAVAVWMFLRTPDVVPLAGDQMVTEETILSGNEAPLKSLGSVPPLFDVTEEEAVADSENWQNPFNSNPCFVSGQNTCQYAFNRSVGLAKDIHVYSLILPKKQENQDLFFLFGRMIVTRGSVFEAYQPILSQGEAQPYFTFIDRAYSGGLEHSINPAFLFAVYERVFASAKAREWKSDEVFNLLPPDLFAQKLATNMADQSVMNSTALGQKLQAKDWTPQAKALVYTLATSFNSEVISLMLDEAGTFEKRYYELFAPTPLRGDVTLQFSTTPLAPSTAFSLTEPTAQGYDYALCKTQKAYVCLQSEGTAQCSPFDFFDNYCRSLTNIP